MESDAAPLEANLLSSLTVEQFVAMAWSFPEYGLSQIHCTSSIAVSPYCIHVATMHM